MASECIDGLTAQPTRDSIITMKDKAMESSKLQITRSSKANGNMECEKERDS